MCVQREVLQLFLDAYETGDGPLKTFILRSIKHHVAQAQEEGKVLQEDELIMRVLNHNASVLVARAVAGIGVKVLQDSIDKCEAGGEWWAEAQLWFAASALHGQRAGVELKRAWASIGRVQPETESSRALEGRILTQLLFAQNGYGFGTPEYLKLKDRMSVLRQKAQSTETAGNDSIAQPDAAKYETMISGALSKALETHRIHGTMGYMPLTSDALSQAYAEFVEAGQMFERTSLFAPDIARRCYAANHLNHFCISFPRMHLLPEFQSDVIAGKGCSRLYHEIEVYNFDVLHAELKSMGTALDVYFFAHNEVGVLLWNCDVEAAKAGWRKQIEAWKQIEALISKGERGWGEYFLEALMFYSGFLGGMLGAGEMGMVRELIPHTFTGIALRDPLVASELEKTVNDSPWSWQGPDGYCFWRVETLMLQARSLAAVADEAEVDVEALRAWLPRPDKLIYIAEHEWNFCAMMSGAAHPTILCATLYGTRLNAWDDAEAIVNGVLAIAPLGDGKGFGMQPLVRIEALRVLARCRGACGKAAEACEALEQAASESRAVGYVWMEAASLRDMLQWVEGDKEEASVQIRIAAVTSAFGR